MTVKTYGVMFKAEMIRAYIKGIKNQTRRLKGLEKINRDPDGWKFEGILPVSNVAMFTNIKKPLLHYSVRPPYGMKDDTLWFKETYAPMCKIADPVCWCETEEEIKENHYVEYRADTGNLYPGDWPEEEAKGNDEAPKWCSSMFMSQKYSRFTDIQILKVRVERLHDIKEQDAILEGIQHNWMGPEPCPPEHADEWMNYLADEDGFPCFSAIDGYRSLWDSINGRTFPWKTNPWVFVYEFPKHKEQS